MQVFGFFLCLLFLSDTLGSLKNNPQCPQLKLRFGRVRYRQRGKIARFLCNTGYMLAGDKYSVCAHGRWDNASPKCVRATCQKVKPPANGLIYPSHSGAVLNFFCMSNFELRGHNITYCDGDKWDNVPPTCLATNTTPPLSCNFEREDICGWTHDPNHDFDWTRMNYATPSGSIGTGPSYDHTKGETGKDGYYMYIESSARNNDDKARLISPVYDKTTENVCFEFFYHMYGKATGDLHVYLKKVNEPWNLDPKEAIFSESGNKGNKWLRAVLNLGTMDNDYQLIIEGVRGSGYTSDIAIDDVKVIPNCRYEEWATSTTEDPLVSTEQPISVESCENRCQTNDTQKLDFLITCDCDDGCFDRNRCCPDFFDFCVSGTTLEDFTEETTMTTVTIPTTISTSTTVRPTIKQTTKTTTRTTITTTTTTAKSTRKKDSKIIYVTPDSDMVTLTVSSDTEIVTPGLPSKESEPVVNDSDKSTHDRVIVPVKASENNTKTVIFAVGVVFGALFAAAGMAFIAKRYRLFRCFTLRRLNHSSNGDSQSDVRFLTGEEILDFNLPSDYHTM